MRVGLFGGSFDPVHLGHQDLVKRFIADLSLDRVFVIPAFVSPFKLIRPPIASPEDRVAMLKLAFEGESKVEILTDEIDRKEISYTVDTIKRLLPRFSEDQLFLLLSEELRETFSTWKESQELEKMVQIVYGKVKICVSSTTIREKLSQGKRCDQELSGKVLDYIEKHHLYCPTIWK